MIKKEDIISMMKKLPEIESRRIELEQECRKQNPFWPFRMTPELLEAIKKWDENNVTD